MTTRRSAARRPALALMLLGLCSLTATAAEVVVLKDGFVIQGNVRKETEAIFDKGSGRSIVIQKVTGMDILDEGPKVTFYSSRFKQPGAVSPDTKLRPEGKAFLTKLPGVGTDPLPGAGEVIKTTEYNAKWVRELTVRVPAAAPEVIKQQITYMDPYFIYVASSTHRWRLSYRTTEWDPKLVRKLLMSHPEVAEPDGKCDPLKRAMLAKFLLDAGWLQLAKDELERLKKDFKGEMSKDAKAQHEAILKEIDKETAELVAREAELALAAGRYKYAAQLLAIFPEKTAGTAEVARVAKVTAELKTNQGRYDAGRRLLRGVIDDSTGMTGVNARAALGGGLALAGWAPPKDATPRLLGLAAGAEQVLAEVHPDSAIRVEMFVTLAEQAERERQYKRPPTKTPEELLATAVSGWAKGKNGATTDPEKALRIWSARELVLAYQRTGDGKDRKAILDRSNKPDALSPQEIAQLISLLPPAEPEDLDNRSGEAVKLERVPGADAYRRRTPPVSGQPNGITYLVNLPPEYHHGRAYPVLIVLGHAGINAEDVLAPLVAEADKNGYILVVPEWTNQFGQGWQWQGEDHVWVTAALRDAVRHFTVDNDKVFMLGVGEGANMAMDVGASHPDLFAGVIPMGPIPRWGGMFIEYWKNAQLLPYYVVTGEFSGEGPKALKLLYEKWARYGFPCLMSVYKGRGVEWFSADVPVLFDWMSRKTRATPTASLKLDTRLRQRWQMLRDTDTHFYWLQADDINPGRNGGAIVPAEMIADIRGNNLIDIQQRGVRQFTVWLSSDMIDWTKPVRLQINYAVPNGFKPKVVAPSLEVLLEDYYNRGDRRTLFLGKITVP